MRKNAINEIGQAYGSLEVLSASRDKNGKLAWLCQCKCGNQKIVRGSDLRSGKITTCGIKGCPEKSKRSAMFLNEIGNHYGRLTVLSKAAHTTSEGKIIWICECSCPQHTIVEVVASDLRSGKTQSCGCLQKEKSSERRSLDLTSQRFGKLLASSLSGKQDKHKNNYWLCRCDCGNTIEVVATSLISGNTNSCGCLNSYKEFEIAQILNQYNIEFVQQYTFDDLIGQSSKLRFDFALFNQSHLIGLIEYQGIQHYIPIDDFGGIAKFNLQIQYDQKKMDYCQLNDIPLLILNKNNINLTEDILLFYERNK